jgi:hypothetical protein
MPTHTASEVPSQVDILTGSIPLLSAGDWQPPSVKLSYNPINTGTYRERKQLGMLEWPYMAKPAP